MCFSLLEAYPHSISKHILYFVIRRTECPLFSIFQSPTIIYSFRFQIALETILEARLISTQKGLFRRKGPHMFYIHSCSFFTFLFILSGSRCFRTFFVVAFVVAFVRLKTAVSLVNTRILTYECVAFAIAFGVAFVGASFRNHFVPF